MFQGRPHFDYFLLLLDFGVLVRLPFFFLFYFVFYDIIISLGGEMGVFSGNLLLGFWEYFVLAVSLEDALDGAKLLHHFLVVGSALEAVFSLDNLTHLSIDFQGPAFLDGEVEEMVVVLEEFDVPALLGVRPAISVTFIFCLFRGELFDELDGRMLLFLNFDLGLRLSFERDAGLFLYFA